MIDATPKQTSATPDKPIINNNLFWHTDDISYFAEELYREGIPASHAKVGIVDTGCDTSHPCLYKSDIDEIDFTAFEQGGTYQDDRKTKINKFPVDLSAALSKLNLDKNKNEQNEEALIRQLINDFGKRDKITSHHNIENPAHRYGYHGLACAGLIAADEPVNDKNNTSALSVDDIGFRGILPGCSLVSVSTPFGYDVKPMIRALLYCLASDVDVILLPRGIDNRSFRSGLSDNPEYADVVSASNDDSEQINLEFDTLNWLLKEIAKTIPLVVASGNSGLDTPEYPANPQCENMIIVGAHNADGYLSSYTSGRGQLLTVTAPSDDDENSYHSSATAYDHPAVAIVSKSTTTYEQAIRASDRTIMSLDTVSHLKPRLTDHTVYGDSLAMSSEDLWKNTAGPIKGYQYFGGTSAASSIVAGAVAYIQAYSKSVVGERLPVTKIHKLLQSDKSKKTGVPRLNLSVIHNDLVNSIRTETIVEEVEKSVPA